MHRIILALAGTIALPFSVSAQSYQPGSATFGNEDRRATLGVTIPFGGGGTQSEREPRLELRLDHGQRDANGFAIRDSFDLNSGRSVRLGFTLTEQPKMMLNGRAMPEMNGRNNISDGVWIGAGVVAVLGLGFYLMATGELSGPTD